jgi:hypothetical protein
LAWWVESGPQAGEKFTVEMATPLTAILVGPKPPPKLTVPTRGEDDVSSAQNLRVMSERVTDEEPVLTTSKFSWFWLEPQFPNSLSCRTNEEVPQPTPPVGLGVGVKVELGVAVTVEVAVRVGVEVAVPTAAVGVNVAVRVGEKAAVRVGEAVAVKVTVRVAVEVAVPAAPVAVKVGVCVGEAVDVRLGLAVAVEVRVRVGVEVADAVGVRVEVTARVDVGVAVGTTVPQFTRRSTCPWSRSPTYRFPRASKASPKGHPRLKHWWSRVKGPMFNTVKVPSTPFPMNRWVPPASTAICAGAEPPLNKGGPATVAGLEKTTLPADSDNLVYWRIRSKAPLLLTSMLPTYTVFPDTKTDPKAWTGCRLAVAGV